MNRKEWDSHTEDSPVMKQCSPMFAASAAQPIHGLALDTRLCLLTMYPMAKNGNMYATLYRSCGSMQSRPQVADIAQPSTRRNA